MTIQFTCVANLYYLALFNSATLHGNILLIGASFGTSELIGILFGERLMVWIHPIKGLMFSLFVIIFISVYLKCVTLQEEVLYVIFMVEVFFLGIAFNIIFILQDIMITDLKLKSTSLELNYAIP
jgi:predicted MFS family arabinose efflux permease